MHLLTEQIKTCCLNKQFYNQNLDSIVLCVNEVIGAYNEQQKVTNFESSKEGNCQAEAENLRNLNLVVITMFVALFGIYIFAKRNVILNEFHAAFMVMHQLHPWQNTRRPRHLTFNVDESNLENYEKNDLESSPAENEQPIIKARNPTVNSQIQSAKTKVSRPDHPETTKAIGTSKAVVVDKQKQNTTTTTESKRYNFRPRKQKKYT